MLNGSVLFFLTLAIVAQFCLTFPLNPDDQLVVSEQKNGTDHFDRTDNFTQQHPKRLDMIGTYKNKTWYIIRTKVPLYIARWICEHDLDFKLARFESADEIQFIVNNTESGDDLAWTDAESIPSISSYSWGDYDVKPITGNFLMRNDDRLGLTIGRYSDMSRLVTTNVFSQHYYICYKINPN